MIDAFLILLLVIIIILFIGGGCVMAPKISKFTNTYKHYDNQLENLKKNFGIGKPSGVLSYIPNQNNCNVKSNLLVQDNVAFKPTRHGSGCTYVNLRYPG